MKEYYYSLCFDDKSNPSNFYHCVALAETKEAFKTTVLQHRNVRFTQIYTVTDYLKESGYKKEIVDLTQKITVQNPVVFSQEISFFSSASKEEKQPNKQYLYFSEKEIPSLEHSKNKPSWEQDWIDPNLKNILFNPIDDSGNSCRTYLLVDATSRKNVASFFDLKESRVGLPLKCLFKGEAFEDLEEVAPYLIDMTLPPKAHDDFMDVPHFHRDFFKNHWGKNTGIFIRTTLPLNEVWSHFRKFTRYEDNNGKGFFFRFWESSVFIQYWKHFSSSYKRVRRFFVNNQGTDYFQIIFPLEHHITLFSPNINEIKKIDKKPSPFTIDDEDHEILQQIIDKRFKSNISLQLKENLEGCNDKIIEKVDETVHHIFQFIHKRSRGNPILFDDCFSLSMLVLLLGDVAKDVLQSPLLNDSYIPISQGISLAKESYFETLDNLQKRRI